MTLLVETQDAATTLVVDALRELHGERPEFQSMTLETPLFVAADADADGSGSEASSLGLDSLDALELITMLEEALGTDVIDDLDIDSIRTVGDVVGVVRALLPGGQRT